MLAVVFDLDGTLIDSEPDIRVSLNKVLAANGLAPLDKQAVTGMIGDGAKVLLDRGFAARGAVARPEHLEAFLADYEVNFAVETVPYPGIVGALARLRETGHVLGVCTNKPEGPARSILAALGLEDYFAAVTGGDSTAFRKPDPRHLAATLAALGCDNAVMIGDHHNDMAVAKGLNIPGIFAAWGYGLADGDYIAETADALPGIIARL